MTTQNRYGRFMSAIPTSSLLRDAIVAVAQCVDHNVCVEAIVTPLVVGVVFLTVCDALSWSGTLESFDSSGPVFLACWGHPRTPTWSATLVLTRVHSSGDTRLLESSDDTSSRWLREMAALLLSERMT